MKLAAAAALVLAFTAVVADAKVTGTPTGFVLRYPSGALPDPGALQNAMLNPQVSAIVFERGTQLFSDTLFVFRRSDLTLCGATGNPKDVVIQSTAATAFYVEQAERVTFRGITIDTSATFGRGVRVVAVPDATVESFARDVSVDRCRFAAYIGVEASVRARDVSVSDSTFRVRGQSAGSSQGGVGVVWEDGAGFTVTRCRFTADPGVTGTAGIFVRGAQSPTSEGDRATRVLVTKNEVEGDFAVGLDLADLNGALVRGNRVQFPNSKTPDFGGRVGIVVRRAAASQVTEGYKVVRNRVRKAHYGVWLFGVNEGSVTSNDLRGCASAEPDSVRFQDHGAAVRVDLNGLCNTNFSSNDFTGLKSPKASAAVVMLPSVLPCQGGGNRVDPGRPVFGEPNP